MNESRPERRGPRTDVATDLIPTDGLLAEERPEEVLTPGAQLGGRYRIVTRLGRGGMGVVYRADDLKLGEPVALKFLSRASAERARVAALVDEVRIGRKIAHPNVCRVHDIVEIGARHFISMEFVEGEDLDLLIRRAGRLPARRAFGIARDVCEGVRALHDAGIIHRDLKPANVLVDRHGRARVSDFGLATHAEARDEAGSSLSGTLPYMAPEQFTGAGTGKATDIYSLGLILWELFAGERALESATFESVVAFHAGGSRVRNLAAVVPDIPVAVEDVVMRCLDHDPAARPASVDEILHAIPGGDPLDEALEEGLTPTPEMVAAASMKGVQAPRTVAILFALIVAATAFNVWSFRQGARVALMRELPSPSRMDERARALLARFGVAVSRSDAGDWVPNRKMIDALATKDGADRWDPLFAAGSPYRLYWFRAGPDLEAWSPGPTSFEDPPFVVAGMSGIVLDPGLRLVSLRYVHDGRVSGGAGVSWESLFEEAGLDPLRFEEIPPPLAPANGADEVRAWRGMSPVVKETEVVVVAGWLSGTPVWFEVLHPWDLEAARGEATGGVSDAIRWGFGALLVAIGAAATLAARRNLRRGRGDARGAWNLSIFLFVSWIVFWLISTELRGIQGGVAYGALIGACSWFAYVAVEPEVRRRWPRVLVGWTRLLHGRVTDARVGQEILIGILVAMVMRGVTTIVSSLMIHFGMPVPDPTAFTLRGSALAELGEISFDLVTATMVALALLTALALLSKVIRDARIGIAILCVVILLVFAPAGAGVFALLLAVPLVVLIWQGLLAAVTVYFAMFLSSELLGMQLDRWYAPQVVLATVTVTGLSIAAAVIAARGRAGASRVSSRV